MTLENYLIEQTKNIDILSRLEISFDKNDHGVIEYLKVSPESFQKSPLLKYFMESADTVLIPNRSNDEYHQFRKTSDTIVIGFYGGSTRMLVYEKAVE